MNCCLQTWPCDLTFRDARGLAHFCEARLLEAPWLAAYTCVVQYVGYNRLSFSRPRRFQARTRKSLTVPSAIWFANHLYGWEATLTVFRRAVHVITQNVASGLRVHQLWTCQLNAGVEEICRSNSYSIGSLDKGT